MGFHRCGENPEIIELFGAAVNQLYGIDSRRSWEARRRNRRPKRGHFFNADPARNQPMEVFHAVARRNGRAVTASAPPVEVSPLDGLASVASKWWAVGSALVLVIGAYFQLRSAIDDAKTEVALARAAPSSEAISLRTAAAAENAALRKDVESIRNWLKNPQQFPGAQASAPPFASAAAPSASVTRPSSAAPVAASAETPALPATVCRGTCPLQ